MTEERAVFVYTTYPSLVEAERIGKAVLEQRLAACVNILPGMISHYWWQGAIERGEEVVMIIKTRASLAESVRAAVKAHAFLYDAGDPGAADRGRRAGLSGMADAGDGGEGKLARSAARHLRRAPEPGNQYVTVPSMPPLRSWYSLQLLLPQIASIFSRKSAALSLLPCSTCHMP